MNREQKLSLIDEARKEMVKNYNGYFERGDSHSLQKAANCAAIISALLADLG